MTSRTGQFNPRTVPLNRVLGRSQNRSGRFGVQKKLFSAPGLELHNIQLVEHAIISMPPRLQKYNYRMVYRTSPRPITHCTGAGWARGTDWTGAESLVSSLGEESTSISVAAFPTLELVGQSVQRILQLDLHFHPINCKSSRNYLLRTKRCASVVDNGWCTHTR